MKKIALLLCVAAVLASCSHEEHVEQGSGNDTQAVYLSVGLDNNGFVTGTETEPMTRAGSYATYINPIYDCVILKQLEEDWIVERVMTPVMSGLPSDNIITGSTRLVSDYRIDLTPGHYHMLVVVNDPKTNAYSSGINSELIPGYRIPEKSPWAVGYTTLSGQNGFGLGGEKNLTHEVFAGTVEFDVVKQTGLEPAMTIQAVDVNVVRRVGTIGIYLKEDANQKGSGLVGSVAFDIRATSGKFCEGIDVFGEPYYSDEGLTQFSGFYFISEDAATCATSEEKYNFPVRGSRVAGHFYYTDEEKDVPFAVTKVDVGFQSGTLNYEYAGADEITGTLRHNRTSHLTFYSTGTSLRTGYYDLYSEYVGDEAVDLFPPDFMWTTAIK